MTTDGQGSAGPADLVVPEMKAGRAKVVPEPKAGKVGLDLRRLAVLVSVARTGSLTGAAEELGVTQPAIGQQLRALEAQCGVSLVVRAGRGVQLTPAGTALANRAMPILAAIGDVESELEAIRRGVTGAVRVGATSGAFRPLVVPALRAVQGRVEDLRIELLEISTDCPGYLLEPLLDGNCDIAVVPDRLSGVKQPDLISAPLVDMGFVVVVPDGHELAKLPTVSWSRISHGHVLTTGDVAAALPLHFLRTATGAVGIMSATDTVVELVRTGSGVALLPELQVGPGLVSRPLEDDIRLRYIAVTRRHFEPTPAMRALLDALASAYVPVQDDVRAEEQQGPLESK